MTHLRKRDDSGAALVLALAMITIVSIGLLGLGSLVDTGLRENRATSAQADTNYAYDGAVDTAVTYVRDDTTLGRQTPAKDCSYTVPDGSFSGVSGLSVQCTPQPGSGVPTPGSYNPDNTPDVALLATSTTETGLAVTGGLGAGKGLAVDGPVQSNSPLTTGNGSINVSSGSALTVTNGQTLAAGSCLGGGTYSPACTTPTAAHADYASDSKWNADALPTNVVTVVPATTCASVGTVTLGPGIYRDAAALSAVTSSTGLCAGKTINFTSGTYYFDFPAGAGEWTMTGAASAAQIHVVAGQLTATPTVVGSACKTDQTGATDGVQFVFNGESRINVLGAHFEACPKPNTTRQQIALYDLRSFASSSSGTVARSATSASPTNGQTAFTSYDSGRVIDGSYATYSTSNKNGQLALTGYDFSAIPAGSTINSVDLTVAYQGDSSSGSLALTAASGTQSTTVSSASPCTATSFCLDKTARTLTRTNIWPTATLADLTSGATLTFVANMNKTVNGPMQVDGATLTVKYTTTTSGGASGCLTVRPYGSAGSCAFLKTDGSSVGVSIHGTVYAWDAPIDLNLPNNATQVLARGAVARVLDINVPASFTSTDPVVSLPGIGSAGAADRDVVFVVYQGGVPRLRARVVFQDNSTKKALVKAWSVY